MYDMSECSYIIISNIIISNIIKAGNYALRRNGVKTLVIESSESSREEVSLLKKNKS